MHNTYGFLPKLTKQVNSKITIFLLVENNKVTAYELNVFVLRGLFNIISSAFEYVSRKSIMYFKPENIRATRKIVKIPKTKSNSIAQDNKCNLSSKVKL